MSNAYFLYTIRHYFCSDLAMIGSKVTAVTI